jgi:hypothetical protein
MYQCQFCEILWAPYAHRSECIDIGIMMLCDEIGFAKVEFVQNKEALQCSGRSIDIEFIRALEEDFASKIADPASRSVFEEKVLDWSSNALRFSPFTGVLTSDPDARFDALKHEYLSSSPPLQKEADAPKSEHAAIRRNMVAGFKKYEVWNHMVKQISMREYVANCRMKLDCGYLAWADAVHRQFKMFHALDIEQDRDRVSQLVDGFPEFRKSMMERMNLQPNLTVIGRDWKNSSGEIDTTPFDSLHRAGIETATIRDVSSLAMTARQELGLRPM